MESIKKLIKLGWDDEYPTGKLLKQCELELEALLKCKTALEMIRNDEGKVCKIYEGCDHTACQSSYEAWAIADKALLELSELLFRVEIDEINGGGLIR